MAGHGFLDAAILLDTVFSLDIEGCAKVEKEDDHDGEEDDGWAPSIVGPVAGHANAGVGADFSVGGVEQMDKGCGDDDAGSKVACKEVDIHGDTERFDVPGDDGEKGESA